MLTGLFLGLAMLTKFYPLVLLPALYTARATGRCRRRWRRVAVVGYSLYLSVGKGVFGFLGGYVKEEGIDTGTRFFLLELAQASPGLRNVADTRVFHLDRISNGWVLGIRDFENELFMVFAALVFGALALWAWRVATPLDAPRTAFLRPAFGLALALMLLFSPHYPWYVAWLIPFLVLMPNLPVLAYVGGLFYLCTTALAVGYGPKQFHLNEILYGTVLIAVVLEVLLRRLPPTRGWFRQVDWVS